MSRRPKLLFLAYLLPPFRAVSRIRLKSIARQLSLLGWDVTVVAPHPSLIKGASDLESITADMDTLNIRRIYTGHRWRCLTSTLNRSYHGIAWFAGGICRRIARIARLDDKIGWYSEAYKACAHLTPDDVDVILATASPFGSFNLARRLSRRLGRPFVMDYRDLWTTGHPHTNYHATLRNKRLETKLLADCAAVSIISPSMGLSLVEQCGVEAEKIHVIPNGYDPADFEGIEPHDFGHFAIIYAGTFYPPKSDVEPLMQALTRLKNTSANDNWRFHYYGRFNDHVAESAAVHGLRDKVVLHGLVPRREVLSAVRGAGAAVVVVSVYNHSELGDRGMFTGKIFELIGLGVPILTVAPPGCDIEEVIQTAGRGRVLSGTDTNGIAEFLADLMNGKAPPSKHPETYSWPQLILKMDTMLRQAAGLPNRNVSEVSIIKVENE